MSAPYATFICEGCAESLECGDNCAGWVGWAERLPPLGFPVECPCCGKPAQLRRVLEERVT
jgi:hypothetical protein